MKLFIFNFFIILLIELLKQVRSISVPPIWITSNFMQAGHKKIIDGTICNCYTGNASTPTSSFTFSTAFPAIPHLAFGIMSYQGSDFMSDEEIQVNRTNLLTTSFSIVIQIRGATNIWILQVRYVAISKNFPHHFNNFDNVPINYTYGPLVNISTFSSAEKTFTNYINYTLQAQNAGSTYTKFSFPLTNNKILLFLTSFASYRSNPYIANSVYLLIDCTILSDTQYSIKATLKQEGKLDKLHFSMIVFDEYDILLSGVYALKYEKLNYTTATAFYQFPIEFLSNFMVGLTQYQSDELRTVMNLNLMFVQNGAQYGLQKNESSLILSKSVIKNYILTVFYLKTWYCPNETFYDHSSSMCIDCPLSQCLLCLNLTFCLKCNNSNLFYLNGSTCDYCNSSLNNFINSSSLSCQPCQLQSCVICASLLQCKICNTSIQYFLNQTDNLCYPCLIFNCLDCLNLTNCLICNQSAGFFLNSSTNLCQICQISNCIQCFSLTQCIKCNNNFGLYSTNPNISICSPCNVSCNCDGYINPWIFTTSTCSALCGDGLIRLGQECDDNNTVSGDGCSNFCTIQEYFVCDNAQPTTCNETLFIQAKFISIIKTGCNQFKVAVQLTPPLYSNQIVSTVSFLNSGIFVKEILDNNGIIQIVAEYIQDIANQTIKLKFSPGVLLNISYSPETPALRYTEDQCKKTKDLQVFFQAIQITSYIILFFSLISCKIVGLQLFGVLQLSYFTLTMQDFFVLYLAPLANFRTFNGINIQITKQQNTLPTNFTRLSVVGSFINNCNIMLILLFGQLIVSILIYLIAKAINKDKLRKISLRMLKQGFITLVIFNIFNISYSAGVHWKYASAVDDWYIISCVILYGTLIAVIVATFAMCITDAEDYGQFKNKFKHVWICRAYIPLTILYRATLGLYTALQSDYSQGTLLIIGYSIAFMLYYIANFPFYNTLQNYRAFFIHLTMLYTLLTSNYYGGMKMNTPYEIKARQYTVAIIQLVLITVSLGISALTLGYEILKILKQCKSNQQIQDNGGNPTEQSIQHL